MGKRFLFVTVWAAISVLASGCAAATPTAAPTETPAPTAAPEPYVIIRRNENSQTELIPSVGPRVFIDVTEPYLLSAPPTAEDILVYTHGHDTSYNPEFESSFPGRKLVFEEGEIRAEGVMVREILSSHNDLAPEASGGSNYIVLIEMAGLRIAHFGDIGQAALTDLQLGILGDIDIAFSQLVNEYSFMSLENRKGFVLMEQLNPKMMIPLRGSGIMPAIEMALAEPGWVGYAGTQAGSIVRRSDLSTEKTIFLIPGRDGETMGKIFKLLAWPEAPGQ